MSSDPQPASSPETEEPNPFAERLAADPTLGQVSLGERARLNAISSYARGTLVGAANMPILQRDAAGGQQGTDEFGNPVGAVPASPRAGALAEALKTDLARYETMRSFEGPLEGAVALAGQLGGGALSPESYVTRLPGLTPAIERIIGGAGGRIAAAGVTQGAVRGVVNPAIQGAEMQSGMRDGFSGSEFASDVALGGLFGAGLHGALSEAPQALARGARGKEVSAFYQAVEHKAAESRDAEAANMAALASEDPSLRGEGMLLSSSSNEAAKTNAQAAPVDRLAEISAPVAEAPATASPSPAEGGVEPGSTAPPSSPAMDAPAVVASPDAAAAKAAADVPERIEKQGRDAAQGMADKANEQSPYANIEYPNREAADKAGIAPSAVEKRAEEDWHGAYPWDQASWFQRLGAMEAAAGKMLDERGSGSSQYGQPGLAASGLDDADRVKKQWRAETPYHGTIGRPGPDMPAHRVSTASGRQIEVAPRVIEAADLVTSSDAGFDAAVQPRQRERAASQAQIRDIATNLDPERLGYSAEADRGAPIVGADRMVESGNGRVLALRRVYEQGGEAAERYRSWLADQGVDVSAFREPVLVRERLTPLSAEERGAFGTEANQAATLAMSASERAMADARLISPEMLDQIRNPDDLGALANLDFRKAFVRALPATEHGALVGADGSLSSEGLTRVRNAVLARAYGNGSVLARVAEATSDDIKSISNALASAAPDWAKLRSDIAEGAVRADVDLTPGLLEAVTRTADLRGKGQKLDTFLAQQDAFDRVSAPVEAWMRMFYDEKGRRAAGAPVMAARLKAYAVEARKVSAENGLDLGLAPVSSREIQAGAALKGGKDAGQQQAGLSFRRAPGGAAEQGIQFRRGSGDGPGDGAAGGQPGPGDGGAGSGGAGRPGDAAGPASPSDVALTSLQQQSQALADALDLPLRQGRVRGGKDTLGQYDTGQDVTRVRNVADFQTVAHEAAHALERRVEGLPDLVQRFSRELGPLDYEPQRGDAREGFGEWMRDGMYNPATMQARAPGFTAAFRDLMSREQPETLAALDAAAAGFRRYQDASGAEQASAIVRPAERETILKTFLRDGIPTTIRMYLSRAYKTFFDDKTDIHKAVRQMARSIYQATGERVRLEGADNPENLARLFVRSQQAAIQDLSHGVRPWHQTVPEGPSLHDAISTATGKPSLLGRWDEDAIKAFDDYLVMLRSDVLYKRFEAGEMPNRPVAMSKEKVQAAIAEAEATNPNFRAGADQVHGYTRQLLRKQYEGGLIDAELYGRLMDEEFYVPLFRHMDDKSNAGTGSSGSDGPGTVDTIKRLRGSDRDVIPPTQSLITQTLLVNRTLQHNDIIRSLVALARTARENGAIGVGRLIEEIPATQMMGKKFDLSEAVGAAAREAGTAPDDLAVLNGALTDVFGEDPILGTIFRAEPTGKRGEPVTFYKEGGQLRAVRLSSEHEGLGLYEAVSSLPLGSQDVALKMLAYASGVTRASITSDPTFVVSNFIRDQMATAIVRPDYIPFVSGLRGIKSEVTQDNFAQMYVYGGGVSPGAGAAGLSELIQQDVNALARKGWLVQKVGGIGDLMRGDVASGFKAFAEFAGTAESATRLSVFGKVYEQKKGQGLSDYDAMIEAAAQATDLMDFGRHGSGTLYIRKLVPFINAWAQGIDKGLRRNMIEPLFRAATGDIVTEADATALRNAPLSLAKFAAVGGGIGYLYGLWASKYDAYHDADEKLRATHMIIPGAAFGLDPATVFAIPKPFELALGFNLGELAGISHATGDPRAAEWALGTASELLLPNSPLTGIPFQSTYIDLKQNKSLYTGRPIVSERDQNREHPELEFNERTSGLAKAIGRTIGVSPIKVDYAIGSQFGSLGRNLVAATNAADPNAPTPAPYDTMFARRWIKAADRTSETTKAFWDAAGQQTGTYAQAKNYFGRQIETGHTGEALDYLAKLPAAQRAYVTLFEGGDDDRGKAVFSADERRLHPIVRGGAAAQQVGNLIKEMTANRVETFEGRAPIKLNPDQRRAMIDDLRLLQAMEMQNALALAGTKGYAGRPLLSTEAQFEVIKAKNPEVASELATRYATNKILPTQIVADLWPDAQKALLADGSQADIRDLALTAKGEGWAFGGEAVRKPQRRRITITPGENPRASEPSGRVPGPTARIVPNPLQ